VYWHRHDVQAQDYNYCNEHDSLLAMQAWCRHILC